jgi:hypothetical protein
MAVVISGLLIATARQAFLKRLVKMRHWPDKISEALMMLIGLYLIHYYLDTYCL